MPERVLVLLKPQFLGDAVMACPLINSLAEAGRLPVVMCGPVVEAMLAPTFPRAEFARGEKIAGVRAVLRTSKAIRMLNVETAFVVNRSFRSALAVRMAGVPNRIGHRTEGRGALLTHSVPYDALRFEASCYLDLLGPNIPALSARPSLAATPTTADFDFGVQPGARYREKQIPLATLAAVVNALIARGFRGVLLGGKEEAATATEFESQLSGATVNRVGLGSIQETMSLLSGLKAMIGSDTGLMHVAAAAGCPTVTVFGPNPASKWGHRYPPHEVLESPKGRIERIDAEVILEASHRILDLRA